MNKYGKIVNGVFTAYPYKYDTVTKKRILPTDEEIAADGWKKVLAENGKMPNGDERKNMKPEVTYADVGKYIVKEINWVAK